MPIIENNQYLIQPQNNIQLWRYMDLATFFDFIINKNITFIRADLFEDKYEGSYTKLHNILITKQKEHEKKGVDYNEGYWNFIKNRHRFFNRRTYISSWITNENELVHMWKIYSKENGVAVKTNYINLKKSLANSEVNIFPSFVEYIDFDNNIFLGTENILTPYIYKRIEYQSESEFRLIINELPEVHIIETSNKNHSYKKNKISKIYRNTKTVKASVNIDILIEKIRLSPFAPKWYLKLIKDFLVLNQLSIEDIKQSDL